MSKKDPFPNDWEEIYNMDDEDFDTPAFLEVLQDSMLWHLPDPYCCIMRVWNRDTNQIKELAYRRESIANQKIKEYAQNGFEVTVMTDEIIGAINYPDDQSKPKRRRS